MAELKTQKNDASVEDFINSVPDETKRQDARELLKIFAEATGQPPVMWGSSIIGYGQYHYKSERSSQEGDWMMTGFSPRKATLTIYIMPGFGSATVQADLAKLGKSTTSQGSCIYIKRLADVDTVVLQRIIAWGYNEMKKQSN